MVLKWILLALAAMPYLYGLFRLYLFDVKRQEPLPEEVRDVYTPERWQTFLDYKADQRIPYLLSKIAAFLLDAFLILSPFYSWMERIAGGNPYGIAAVTSIMIMGISALIDYPFSRYSTFQVEEKYGLNHRSLKEFHRDFLLNTGGGMVLNTALYLLLCFILVNLPSWTNQFQISLFSAFLITAGIVAVLAAFMVGASYLSWFLMRKQYRFTPLEEGELKTKILELIKDSRKKVKAIEVYNESAKSTSKNAFVLKLLFNRRIGIADNFLNENDERELLAVLAHEAGHLKHKPTIWNVLKWILFGLVFAGAVFEIYNGALLVEMEQEVESVFGLHTINVVLSVAVVSWILTPVISLINVFLTFVTRTEEYEADRNAVAEGYGTELISTFKTLSSDELVDVNPPELIEALEYDHPGMTSRIRAIHQAMRQQH